MYREFIVAAVGMFLAVMQGIKWLYQDLVLREQRFKICARIFYVSIGWRASHRLACIVSTGAHDLVDRRHDDVTTQNPCVHGRHRHTSMFERLFPVTVFIVVLSSSIYEFHVTVAVEFCPEEKGGGVCPDRNTCCATKDPSESSCITEPAHPYNGSGVCCNDIGIGDTGCGPGYECASESFGATRAYFCRLIESISQPADDVPRRLPRYRLCSLPKAALLDIHSLPVTLNSAHLPQLAYYSTLGAIDSTKPSQAKIMAKIRIAVIVVHGSGRNADDYLCCTASAVSEIKGEYSSDVGQVLVIAPRFLAPEDGPVNVTDVSVELLRWNETDPIPHTWRYGANAINGNVSSYDAMDALVSRLVALCPLLKRIVVAGHSAGGQFTQRWALTSSIKAWESKVLSIHVIVANPRSFCYLNKRRFLNGTLQLPPKEMIDACPGYNLWEWGLDPGGNLYAPYKDHALEEVGGVAPMTSRYVRRNVTYLAGELDVLPVYAGCEDDDFQGKNRRERSRLFFGALSKTYRNHLHRRFVIRHVPHDHCLIFQSRVFRDALSDASPLTTSLDNVTSAAGYI